MIAGLPGAGIGALFYMILVLVLPLRNLWLGDFTRRSWKMVAELWAMFLGIGFVTGWQVYLMHRYLPDVIGIIPKHVAQQAANVTIGMLLFVVIGLAVLNLVLDLIGKLRHMPVAKPIEAKPVMM